MGKHYVWTCDVCGKQVKDGSENNFQVALSPSGMEPSKGMSVFDGIVCDDCTAKKTAQEILFEVAEAGKKSTNLIVVDSVTFKKISVDNTIAGVELKSASEIPIDIKP